MCVIARPRQLADPRNDELNVNNLRKSCILQELRTCHCETPPVGGARQSRMLKKQYAIYIMTNKYNTVFYTGVTNNLIKRVF